jgi:hypothetical protein
VATLIAIELAKILGPSRPPRPKPPKVIKLKVPPKLPRSLTRIAETERGIELGVDLLRLSSRFIQLRRALFGLQPAKSIGPAPACGVPNDGLSDPN